MADMTITKGTPIFNTGSQSRVSVPFKVSETIAITGLGLQADDEITFEIVELKEGTVIDENGCCGDGCAATLNKPPVNVVSATPILCCGCGCSTLEQLPRKLDKNNPRIFMDDMDGLTLRAIWNNSGSGFGTASVLRTSSQKTALTAAEKGCCITPKKANLRVKKTVSDTLPKADSAGFYTIVVTNNGPDNANGTIVKDDLPSGLAYGAITPVYSNGAVGSTPSEADLRAGYVIPVFPVGAVATYTVNYTVPAASVGQVIKNKVVVTPPEGLEDTDLTDNEDEVYLTVVEKKPKLTIDKAVSNASPVVGDAGSFTLTIKNEGIDSDTNIVLTDVLPAGLAYVEPFAVTGGSVASVTAAQLAAGVQVAATLAAAGVITVQIPYTVTAAMYGKTIQNTASVQSATGSASDSVVVSVEAEPVIFPEYTKCGGSPLTSTDEVLVKGSLLACDNTPLPCGAKLKQCCDLETIVGYPTGLFNLTGCIIGSTTQTDSYGRLVWRSRDDTTIASRGLTSNGQPFYIQFDVTNPFDCDALVEVSMQAHTESINSQADGTQEITYIHKVGDTLNVDPYPYGSVQWQADNDGWSFSTNSFNSDAGNVNAGSTPPTFPTFGGATSQTTPPARLFRNIAAGQTLTFYAQFWIVVSDTVFGDGFSLHAGFTKSSYWKITRGGRVV